MSGSSGNPVTRLPPALDFSLSEGEREILSRSVASVRNSGQTRWIAQVVEGPVIDPLECYARAGTADRFFWARSEAGLSKVAIGLVDEVESAGSSRFRDVRAWMLDVRSRIDWIGVERPSQEATFFGGFGFEGASRGAAEWKSFPAARFVLPALIADCDGTAARWVLLVRVEGASTVESVEGELLERAAERDRLVSLAEGAAGENDATGFSLPASSHDWPAGPEFRVRSDRSHEVFCAQVRSALDAIETGELSKLVLARSLSVDHDGMLDVPDFLARLRSLYPTCTLIAMGRGQDTFLAATPEMLIRVRGLDIETAALAGSAPRGRSPDEDRAFAAELQSSRKECAEHRYVVDGIRDVLEPCCEILDVPREPKLRALFGIQHLETPISGRLKGGRSDRSGSADVDILDLVERLHPTPAVGGFPREPAGDWLVRCEGLDRGWYAAPIGWLDLAGGGDLCVALRSALIRNGLRAEGRTGASRALLFAGAGIVAGSDPRQELVETRIKLRALLAPLTEI